MIFKWWISPKSAAATSICRIHNTVFTNTETREIIAYKISVAKPWGREAGAESPQSRGWKARDCHARFPHEEDPFEYVSSFDGCLLTLHSFKDAPRGVCVAARGRWVHHRMSGARCARLERVVFIRKEDRRFQSRALHIKRYVMCVRKYIVNFNDF